MINPEFPLLSLLPIASFAIAAAGLAARFFVGSSSAKLTLMTAAFIFLLLASGVLWQQQKEEQRRVLSAANEIITIIGNQKRTYDEILSSLRLPNYRIANAAIDQLIAQNRVGSEAATITDKLDNSFRVRLYFVRTF